MLNKLERLLESERTDGNIFDIIIYGSLVKGKSRPNDIDIAVIFKGGSLRQRLDRIQDIKGRLKAIPLPVDIKQITLRDMFSTDFLARSGIILEGRSVFNKSGFAETLGFKPCALYYYDLRGLSHTAKVRFNYIINGRNGQEGILRSFEGERLARGAVKVPISKSLEFEEVLTQHKISYHKASILQAI